MILSQHVLSFRNQEGEEKNHDASLCDAGNGKIKGWWLASCNRGFICKLKTCVWF